MIAHIVKGFINYNDIRDVSLYLVHLSDLEREMPQFTKLWRFCPYLWEGMGLLKDSWCWSGARRPQWWCRTCSFPLFFPSFSNSWNLFLSHFFRTQNLLMPGSSRVQVFLKSASPYPTAPWLLLSLCGVGMGIGLECPSRAGEPNCPRVWISVANPHLCRYKWSHPHVSKAWRLMTFEISCPRLTDALITVLHLITA